jgi:hypothetical protein
MADYTQPPYGLPFLMPPPPPQFQHLPPDAQNTAADPRHASITESFQFNRGLPGLNFPSMAPNPQAQYPYWPPPPPPAQSQHPFGNIPFPPFLAQNGLPIPPPPQHFFSPVPQLPPQNAPIYSATEDPPAPSVLPQQQHRQQQQSMGAAQDRLVNKTDSDKEDGEVSEGDGGLRLVAGNNRPAKEAPRSVPYDSVTKPANGPRQQHFESSNPHPPNHNYPAVQSLSRGSISTTNDKSYGVADSRASTSHQQNGPSKTVADLSQKREDARRFVKLLHENNIGYNALVNEGLDAQLLRDLYQSVNLPSAPPSAPVPAPTEKAPPAMKLSIANGQSASGQSASSKLQTNVQATPPRLTPAIKTNRPLAIKTIGPPTKSEASPIDRKDYIARLQAAKLAKQHAAAKVSPPQETPPTPVAASTTTVEVPQSSVSIMVEKDTKVKGQLSEAKREAMKRKVELLKALKKGSTTATPGASWSLEAIPPPKTAPLAMQHTETALPSPQPMPMSMPAPSFPRLPGLFMNSAPGSNHVVQPAQPPTTSAQNTSPSIVRKRPVAADFNEATTPRNSAPPYTRTFGQSPHEQGIESMIIEVSDDGSVGSDMDLDDEPALPQPPSTFSPPGLNRNGARDLRDLPPLSNFPSRSGSLKPVTPAVSTPPAVRTPNRIDQDGLAQKEKAILAMKQKIADLSRKKKITVAEKETVAPSPVASKLQTETRPSQINPAQNTSTGRVLASLAGAPRAHPAVLPGSPGTPDTSRTWKRQRRAEIESNLQSINAGLLSEFERLNQLEKEIAEIKAKTLKAKEAKDKLVQELESYGIDTEGMGDEELQAQKDSIEQQKEPELSAQVQGSVTADIPINSTLDTESAPDVATSTQESPKPAQIVPSPGALSTALAAEMAQANPPTASAVRQEMVMPAVSPAMVASTEPESVQEAPQVMEEKTPLPASMVAVKTMELSNGQDITTPMDDGEDFYSPEPAISTNPGGMPDEIEPAEAAAKTPQEEGEVVMSESSPSLGGEEEEEYEPEEVVAPAVSAEPNHIEEVATTLLSSPASTSSEEGELYEPPSADEIMQHAQDVSMVPFPSNDTSLDEVDQGAMDISMTPSDQPESAQQSLPVATDNVSISSNHVAVPFIAVADDLAPELQPEIVPIIQDPSAQLVRALPSQKLC